MEQANDALKTISTVLAICSGVVPVIFGFILWKMSQIFVSKADWDSFKLEIEKKSEKNEMERIRVEGRLESELKRMEEKLDRILERVFSQPK